MEQLRRAGEQAYEVKTGDQPWVSGPAPGWRLQHLPTAAGQPPGRILHRRDCWIDNGEDLTLEEASGHAARAAVELCRLCRPDPPVGPLPTCASGDGRVSVAASGRTPRCSAKNAFCGFSSSMKFKFGAYPGSR